MPKGHELETWGSSKAGLAVAGGLPNPLLALESERPSAQALHFYRPRLPPPPAQPTSQAPWTPCKGLSAKPHLHGYACLNPRPRFICIGRPAGLEAARTGLPAWPDLTWMDGCLGFYRNPSIYSVAWHGLRDTD